MRRLLLAFVLFVSLCTPLAHGLAVSYDYLDHDTLPLSPGATYYYRLVLQNEDDAPITAKVELVSPIATLIGPAELTLPARTFTTSVYLNITVPVDAVPNTTLPVRFIVTPVAGPSDGGQVPFSVHYDRSVNVLVDPNAPLPLVVDPVPVLPVVPDSSSPASQRPLLALGIIGLGALVIIAVVLFARRFARHKPRV